MIAITEIKKNEAKYDAKFLTKMKSLGIDCPKLGIELMFHIVGKKGVPTNTIANAMRTGINDGINVLNLDVETSVDISRSNITTNSPYFIAQIFVPYMLNMIPIKQVSNAKFNINVNNDTDTYKLITSADIKPSSGEHKTPDIMFDQNYHIAILPPRTFLNIANIMSTQGIGYRDGIGHSYSIRVAYNEITPDTEYSIKTTPTTDADPVQVFMQVCRMYIDKLNILRNVVTVTEDYNYVDEIFKVSKPVPELVVYRCKHYQASFGAMIEEFGTMIDSSPETHITYNTTHNTIRVIEIKVRHANVKKYMLFIIDTLLKVWNDIMDSLSKHTA